MPDFTTTRRVEFAETDMAGIVHFANFYRYMEEAEHALFRSLGLRIFEEQEDRSVLSWPRVSTSCSYSGPAFYGDVLEIRVSVERVGTKSLTTKYEFRRGEQPVATGSMTTVYCAFRHGEALRPLDIPPEIRKKLDAVRSDPASSD